MALVHSSLDQPHAEKRWPAGYPPEPAPADIEELSPAALGSGGTARPAPLPDPGVPRGHAVFEVEDGHFASESRHAGDSRQNGILCARGNWVAPFAGVDYVSLIER